MDRLWAPWRLKYITEDLKIKQGCIFCRMLKEKKDKKNFIFIRKSYCFAVLNIYPYNNGHSLILPNRHVKDISQLTHEERDQFLDLVDETKSLLDKILKPQGYNLGINLGRSAGAGYPGHLHLHIVPRWRGDANFMPAIGQTKVISQSLRALYEKLIYAIKKRL